MLRRKVLRLAGAAPLIAAVPATALAAPSARLWDRWTAHDPEARSTVGHDGWDRFLARYVTPSADGINRVAYGAVDRSDRAALKRYLDRLSMVRVGALDRGEQFAFWVNLYNALTMDVVLDHFPVDSIRDIDISPGLFADGPWGRPLIEVEETALGLDDIEHRILRPIWRDPRIHYAVSCAALGCPNLVPWAFTAGRGEALLQEGAMAFVNHDRGCRIAAGQLRLSSLYVWYVEDFGGDDSGVIAHLGRHATGPKAAALDTVAAIAGHSYDWRLNNAAVTLRPARN